MPLALQPFTKEVLNTLPYLIDNKLQSVSGDLQAKVAELIDINSKAENGERLKSDAGLNTARDCWGHVDTIQAAMHAFEAKLYGREGRALLSLLAGEDYETQSVEQRFQRIKGIQNVLLNLEKSERTLIMRDSVTTRSQLSMDFFVVLFQQYWETVMEQYGEKQVNIGQCLGGFYVESEAAFWEQLQRRQAWQEAQLNRRQARKQINLWETYYPNLSEAAVRAIALDATASISCVLVDDFDALIGVIPVRFSRDNVEHMLSGSSATATSTNSAPNKEQEELKVAIQASQQSLIDDGIKREAREKNGRRVITVATTLQLVLLGVTALSAFVPLLQVAFPILTIVSGAVGLLSAMAIGRWGGSAEPCNSFYVTFIGSIMLCASHFIPAASVLYLVQAAVVCVLAGTVLGVVEGYEQGMCGFTSGTKSSSGLGSDYFGASPAYKPLRREDDSLKNVNGEAVVFGNDTP